MANNRGAVIQQDTTIVGKIRNCRQIEIHGFVEGDVVADNIVVHEHGRLYGTVRAGSAEVIGALQGDVSIQNLISIRSSGSVNGHVRYGQLAMEMGADLSAELRNAPPNLAGDLHLSVRRGKFVEITTNHITAIDPDDDADHLTYTVSNLRNGFVAFATQRGTPVTKFLQADIEHGRVLFVHDGGENTSAAFDIVVADDDGATSGAAQTVSISVVPGR